MITVDDAAAAVRTLTEALTQAERDLLYALRNFARYRKEFAVDLAALNRPADPAGDLLYGEDGNIHRSFDHRRFADAVNPLTSRWMVSYNDDLLIRRYFKPHHISTIGVPYTLSAKRTATELLITNYEN